MPLIGPSPAAAEAFPWGRGFGRAMPPLTISIAPRSLNVGATIGRPHKHALFYAMIKMTATISASTPLARFHLSAASDGSASRNFQPTSRYHAPVGHAALNAPTNSSTRDHCDRLFLLHVRVRPGKHTVQLHAARVLCKIKLHACASGTAASILRPRIALSVRIGERHAVPAAGCTVAIAVRVRPICDRAAFFH